MSTKKQEYFSSRLGIILSMMGVAVGAGNIWRFSRIVAQNGGGSFIIPWVLFLFAWSIPLIIAEIALGKKTRKAPIGAFAEAAGPQFGWMGAFVVLVTTGIMCYYSVVCGWGLRYFVYGIEGRLSSMEDYTALWNGFVSSYQPLIFHCITTCIAIFVVYKGIVKGIEKSNKVLIPLLLFIILMIFIRAITLPGAFEGIKYLFTPDPVYFFKLSTWLEALTQNAWDTGAGWGLLLVYAGYMRRRESVSVNGALTAFSNNAISLIMAIIIFSAVYAIEGSIQGLVCGEGSTQVGITFIYLPHLFNSLPGNAAVHGTFISLFFLAFFFAALSSFISMVQVAVQTLNEIGLTRRAALTTTCLISLFFGAPSAINMHIFNNQDSVWGLGLLVSGLFIAFAVSKYGVDKMRQEIINYSSDDFKIGKYYNVIVRCIIPAQGIILICWYFYIMIFQAHDYAWWDPLQEFTVGTILLQWGLGIVLFILCNKWMVKRSLGKQ